MKIRVFSILIALIVMISMMPFASFADETGNASETVEAPQVVEPQSNEVTDKGKTEEKKVTCARVTGVKAKGISKSKIKVTWKKVKGAAGYKVYRWSSKKDKYVLIRTIKSGKITSYTNKGLKANRYKSYKVKAYKVSDGKKIYGKLSKRAKGKTKPRTLRVKAWAYSGGGTTATGKKAEKGCIAVDPKVIKLGTKVYVPGYGKATACDTGGSIKGNIIDVYYSKESSCNKWGVRYVTIKIYD